MKRSSQRLVLRGETVRILANMGLARVVGGNDSNGGPCTNMNVVDSGGQGCIHVLGDKKSS